MKYTVLVSVPNKIDTEASSEEEAKKKILDYLASTRQISLSAPVEITVVQEAIINE